MKSFLSLIVFSFLLFFSCTKEARLITSFDFTVAVEHDSLAAFNEVHPTRFIITPERVAITQNFSFKYTINEGSGALFFKDSVLPLPVDEWIKLDTLNLDFQYLTDSFGSHEIDTYIKDDFDREEIINIGYGIQEEEFELSASITPPIITVGEESTITINIDAPVHSERVEYTLKYQFEQGTGTVKDLEGNILNANEFYPIQVGITKWTVTSLETGAPNINFVCENSTNFKDNASDSFEVQAYVEPFTLAVAQENDLKLSGEAFNISVSAFATTEHDTNINYFVSYQFYGTNRGAITRNGISYAEGEQIPIPHGASNLSFTATGDEDFLIVWKGRRAKYSSRDVYATKYKRCVNLVFW